MTKKLTNKELRELLLESNYSIEALEDEIEYFRGEIAGNNARIWELIQENDKLTMKYNPYRPPGDEDEDIDYYDLKEEIESLKEVIESYEEKLRITKSKKKKNPKAGVVSFDFWPWRDWFRLSYNRWHPGQAAQLCIGPVRVDWFAA